MQEFKAPGQTATRSRATNDILRQYCQNNMDKMQAFIEGRAEMIITKTK